MRGVWSWVSFAVLVPGLAGAADDADARRSVVQVKAKIRLTDQAHPWSLTGVTEYVGSGVVIEGRRILTNAHLINYVSQVTVRGDQSSDEIHATVEAIAPGIDLAVLRVEEDAFFANRPPLPRSRALPKDRDAVLVYGYPTGGTTVSVTKGIVSRIEFVGYYYQTSGLRIQIDAAINPGNSGGPALADGKMIGLAFSRLQGSDNIGYIIPVEEIELFLADIQDGKYDGKPAMFDQFQTLENSALRKRIGLGKGISGVAINRPEPPGPGPSPLREWDVITKIGDHEIDNTGLVGIEGGLRLPFQYLVQRLTRDDKVPLTVIRDARPMAIEVPVGVRRPRVIRNLEGARPSYFIFGPIAFTTATLDLIDGAEQQTPGWYFLLNERNSPLTARRADRPRFIDEELVIAACPLFPHRLSKGYRDEIQLQTVREINGRPIRNLRHLVETLRDGRDDQIVITFAEQYTESLVFDRKEALAATEEILSDNGIRQQCSDDLMPVWKKR
jgi:S1-C subfamily serine protease